jgi:VWFA-related protein
LFAGVVVVSSVAVAQQAASPQQPAGDDAGAYTLKVTTQNVVLDVVVNDRKGNPVTGLKAGDFTVYEDKVPQVLKSFTEVTPESVKAGTIAVNSTAELDRLEPEAPVSIVVIDELALSTMDLAFAEYSLNRYLKGRGDMLDQPTMLIAANSQKIAILHDYTTSRKEILEALKHHDTDYNVLARGQASSWEGEQASAAVGTLIAVAEATAGHRGHKNMIWVGRGFPPIDLGNVPDADKLAFDKALETCSRLLRDSRVTLYTVDPIGISGGYNENVSGDKFAQDPFGGEAGFDTIALASGGQAMHGRNDVDHSIDQTVRDGESFYTLSYRPAVKSDTAKDYRRIKVVMKDPNLVATTRQGYFATPAPVGAMKDADGKYAKQTMYDLTLAADSLLVYDGIPVTVIRDAAAPDKFVLRLRASDVPWKVDAPERESSALTVLMASYDRKGKLLEHSARTMTVHLPVVADGNGPDARAVNLPLTIATAAPVARVRFVVRSNASGKIGAVNFFLVDEKTLTDPAAGLDGKTARK